MTARSHAGASSQNLDSLLDTVANVVGILVVLMAVTQLFVNDAMKRIQVWESEEAQALRDERGEVEAKLASIGPSALAESLELARLRDHIERLTADPEAARMRDAAAVATAVAQRTLRVRKLESELAGERESLSKLRLHLAEAEAAPPSAAIELRLPDPRPAPLHARKLELLARYGRALYPNLERLEDDLRMGLQLSARSPVRYFGANDVGNRDLRWRVLGTPSGYLFQLDWRNVYAGENPAELRAPGSDLRRTLDRYDPGRYYVQFYVWPDSFDAYLAARAVAEERGFQVGWVPYPNGRELTFSHSAPAIPTPVD